MPLRYRMAVYLIKTKHMIHRYHQSKLSGLWKNFWKKTSTLCIRYLVRCFSELLTIWLLFQCKSGEIRLLFSPHSSFPSFWYIRFTITCKRESILNLNMVVFGPVQHLYSISMIQIVNSRLKLSLSYWYEVSQQR